MRPPRKRSPLSDDGNACVPHAAVVAIVIIMAMIGVVIYFGFIKTPKGS